MTGELPAPRRRPPGPILANAPQLTPEQHMFVTERHLATLTTLRSDGSPHVVPVGFTWDQQAGIARVTTHRKSVKVRNIESAIARGVPARVAICQVDGGRWITLEGTMQVETSPEQVAEAVRRYTVRFREPEEDPDRIVLVLRVDKVLSASYMAR